MGKEKDNPIKIFINYRIVHKGPIDINNLFREIPKWFNGFQYDFWETGLTQKDTGIGKEYMSDWKAEREINDYVKFKIVMKLFLKDITEVTINGEKTFVALTEIYFNSEMEKNYRKNFGPDKFQEIIRQIYERYIRYQDLLDYEDKLAAECVDLVNLMKSNLK
jgi:hypothetical protein